MKTTQIRVSRNVKFFADRMMRKFNLSEITDKTAPVVMYGMYNMDDYEFYRSYDPFKIVLWRGTDARIMTKFKADIINSRNGCRHIAASSNVKNSLSRFDINSEIVSITSTPLTISNKPRGIGVYCYVCSDNPIMQKRYNVEGLSLLQKKLPYKFYLVKQKQYTFDKLLEIYQKCFAGIRLLNHDGMSNSILEMGLMGRRTISNSGLPHTIPWNRLSDVKSALIEEYKNRKKDNSKISEDYLRLIDIGEQWLEVSG